MRTLLYTGLNGSVGWACAGVYIPLYLYERYGDKRVLEEHYEDILDYADFMIRRAGKWGGFYSMPRASFRGKNRKYAVNSGRSYGEWAEPARRQNPSMWYDFCNVEARGIDGVHLFHPAARFKDRRHLTKAQDKAPRPHPGSTAREPSAPTGSSSQSPNSRSIPTVRQNLSARSTWDF